MLAGDHVIDWRDAFRGQHLAGEDQAQSLAESDQARQAGGAAPGGQDAELGLGQADLAGGTAAGDAVVAGEREFEAAAEAGAVDRSDRRHRQGGDPVEYPLAERDEPIGRIGIDALQIRAGDEDAGFGGLDDDAVDRGCVRFDPCRVSIEFEQRRLIEEVGA